MSKPDQPSLSGKQQPSPRILIVDDHATTARALEKVLKKEGFDTSVVHRGSEAIALADQTQFDAAVVDIHLPDLSGLVVSRKLRDGFGPRRPIIVLSGDTSMQTLNSLPHVGATYFFSKPVSGSMLVERLKEWLRAAGAAA